LAWHLSSTQLSFGTTRHSLLYRRRSSAFVYLTFLSYQKHPHELLFHTHRSSSPSYYGFILDLFFMARSAIFRAVAAGCASFALFDAAAAELMPRQTAAPTADAAAPEITKVTGCHNHAFEFYCFHSSTEYLVKTTLTTTTALPTELTDCHPHTSDLFCIAPDGSDLQVEIPGGSSEDGHDHDQEGHDDEHEGESEGADERHCHSHAGVE
jgi:hypothetical protein